MVILSPRSAHLRAFVERYPEEIVLVNVRADPLRVIELIASSEYVLSSSLYGLIVADALGKPNRWLLLSRLVGGGGFKFRDYFSAFDQAEGSMHLEPLIIDGSEMLTALLDEVRTPLNNKLERAKELCEELVCGISKTVSATVLG